jgi:hypothetical protein
MLVFTFFNISTTHDGKSITHFFVPAVEAQGRSFVIVRKGTGVPHRANFRKDTSSLKEEITAGLRPGGKFAVDSELIVVDGVLPEAALNRISEHLKAADANGRTWRLATAEEGKTLREETEVSKLVASMAASHLPPRGTVPVAAPVAVPSPAITEELAWLRSENEMLRNELAAFRAEQDAKAAAEERKALIAEITVQAKAQFEAQIEDLKAQLAAQVATPRAEVPQLDMEALADMIVARTAKGKAVGSK